MNIIKCFMLLLTLHSGMAFGSEQIQDASVAPIEASVPSILSYFNVNDTDPVPDSMKIALHLTAGILSTIMIRHPELYVRGFLSYLTAVNFTYLIVYLNVRSFYSAFILRKTDEEILQSLLNDFSFVVGSAIPLFTRLVLFIRQNLDN